MRSGGGCELSWGVAGAERRKRRAAGGPGREPSCQGGAERDAQRHARRGGPGLGQGPGINTEGQGTQCLLGIDPAKGREAGQTEAALSPRARPQTPPSRPLGAQLPRTVEASGGQLSEAEAEAEAACTSCSPFWGHGWGIFASLPARGCVLKSSFGRRSLERREIEWQFLLTH